MDDAPARIRTPVDDDVLVERSVAIAAELVQAAATGTSRRDRRRRARIAAMVGDRAGKDFLTGLVDEVLRIPSSARAARRFRTLVAATPNPSFVTGADRFALRLGALAAPIAPGIVMPLVAARIRHELAGIVLPAEARRYARHARRRANEGIRLNVNLLGEAVLGEGEAKRRAELVVDLLGRPEIDYVSVKISSIAAQLDVLGYADALERVTARLRPILGAAARTQPAKFVNLDMEEYRDLPLTVDAFIGLLREAQFATLDAGIVLQAYLPDSLAALERLTRFARERRATHGGSVKVRIVKGANLAMESVEAELRGWEPAPFATKAEVDANYKRLLEVALAPDNAGALFVGVATHNLFDVGWALALGEALGADDRLELEMLEGMANAEALAIAQRTGSLLLYAPIVARGDYEAAVAYLVRRFDENTAPENFLAHLFDLAPGSAAWEEQEGRFRDAVRERQAVPVGPRRRQDRSLESALAAPASGAPFENVADTDFSLAANRSWIAAALSEAPTAGEREVAAIVAGSEVVVPLSGRGIDPSTGAELYRYVEGDRPAVERAVASAAAAAARWRARSRRERAELLHRIAATMAAERGHTCAVMARDAGKTIGEGDPEVSEAIDLANFYAEQSLTLDADPACAFVPHDVVLVTPPWNFPYAIPVGGVLAALAAGSAVILKPAPETVLTAALIARQCHAAGIDRELVQFLPVADDEVGRALVTHPGIGAVVLTGAWATARTFLAWRPELNLHAETSGKNAFIITAAADLDDAIRDLIRSSFAHAGQKCSAASLAIIEAPVYDDAAFLDRLADAVDSLRVGPAADLATSVGPLIRPPEGPLADALTSLGPGERWLVEPRMIGGNERLWRPGVKLGVAPGSPFHLTECFGPVLGCMRARDLREAIAWANAPDYGLTGGISSLDDGEIRRYLEEIAVGNAYVNRHITGAIVRRQPFGGWKRSSIGPGAKAGGPNYVASLGRYERSGPVDVAAERARAAKEWARLRAGEDPSGLSCEANIFRLRALRRLALRVSGPQPAGAVAVVQAVADEVGVTIDWSSDVGCEEAIPGGVIESEADWRARIAAGGVFDRVRLCGGVGARLALMDEGFEVDTTPLVASGPLELLRLTREQAVSVTGHRHGNLERQTLVSRVGS